MRPLATLSLGLLLGLPPGCVPGALAPQQQGEELPLIPWRRLDLPPEFALTLSWPEAAEHLGEVVAVEGRVVRAYNSGRACFLNFAEDWKGKFQGVIFAASFGDYAQAPEDLFLGKRVRLIGKIVVHQGTPELLIEDPCQIEVLGG